MVNVTGLRDGGLPHQSRLETTVPNSGEEGAGVRIELRCRCDVVSRES